MKTTVRRNVTIEFETCDDVGCCGTCTSTMILGYDDDDGDLSIRRGTEKVYFPKAVLPDVAKAFKILAAEAKEEGL